MATIVPIVEGHGEVPSLRSLIYLVQAHADLEVPVEVRTPIRQPRGKLLREEELERAVQLATNIGGQNCLILVMIDADNDCAAELGPELQARAEAVTPAHVAAVLPVREYEAWLLASASTLAGERGLPTDLEPPDDPEEVGSAKGWLNAQLPDEDVYRETVDQPRLTARIDVDEALSARSFRKFYHEVSGFIAEAE